jgi:hypothetical protein
VTGVQTCALPIFQPHIGSLAGEPIHPLVDAFMRAVAGSL